MKNSKIFIIVAVCIVVAIVLGAGYAYLNIKSKQSTSQSSPASSPVQSGVEGADAITQSATQGALPSINTNPLENKPVVNPVDVSNPFKSVKTNPFQ